MKKFLLFLLGIYIGLVVFMPKDNLYYTFQKYLKKENIYINSSISQDLIKLSLKNAKVYSNNINIADFENINIYPLILFNLISVKNLKLEIGNYKISNLNIYFTPFYPIGLIKGDSSFGKVDGEINLMKRYIKVYIQKPSTISSFLKKDKKGYFYYAKF